MRELHHARLVDDELRERRESVAQRLRELEQLARRAADDDDVVAGLVAYLRHAPGRSDLDIGGGHTIRVDAKDPDGGERAPILLGVLSERLAHAHDSIEQTVDRRVGARADEQDGAGTMPGPD